MRPGGSGMRRAILRGSWLALAFTALATACGPSGVGDPCTPTHPAIQDGGKPCGAHQNYACFDPHEIYIETRSLQCRTRACMVYHWDESFEQSDQSQRVFCTCRCGGEG